MKEPLNPNRDKVFDLAEIDREIALKRGIAPQQERFTCPLYLWAEGAVHRLQADYAREARTEYKERALVLWKLFLNCVIPLAHDAKGKAYAAYFDKLADGLRDLAIHGSTPAGIIAEVQKQIEQAPRLEHLQREKKAVILPQNMPFRRTQVAVLMAEGLKDREIATRLGISSNTVQQHLRFIYSYCHAPNRTVATRRLLESGELSRFKKVPE